VMFEFHPVEQPCVLIEVGPPATDAD